MSTPPYQVLNRYSTTIRFKTYGWDPRGASAVWYVRDSAAAVALSVTDAADIEITSDSIYVTVPASALAALTAGGDYVHELVMTDYLGDQYMASGPHDFLTLAQQSASQSLPTYQINALPGFVIASDLDYYVDSVSGDDSNAGTSIDLPLQSLGALITAAPASGARIGLKRGSAWRESLQFSSKSGVTIAAYGIGNRPLIDGSDGVADDDWSKTGGLTNVYEASVTAATIDAQSWVGCWENGKKLAYVADTATCDSTAGSYTVSSHSTSPFTLYVHATDGTNPGTSTYNSYEVTTRDHPILFSGGTGNRVIGIRTRRNLGNNGSLVINGTHGTILDCVAEDGTKHNVLMGGGAYVDGLTCTNANYGGTNGTMFVINQDDANGENATVKNLTVQIDDYYGVSDHISGINSHQNNSGTYGTYTIEGMTAINLLYAVSDTRHFETINITGLTVSKCSGALSDTAITGDITFTNVTVSDSTNLSTAFNFNAPYRKTATISNYICCGKGDTLAYHVRVRQELSLVLQNSQMGVDGTTGASRRGVQNETTASDITQTNCRFNSNLAFFMRWNSDPNSYTGTGNCYDGGGTKFYESAAGTDLAGWQTATSSDADATTTGCDLSDLSC